MGALGWTAVTAALTAHHLQHGQRALQRTQRDLASLQPAAALADLSAARRDLDAAARLTGSPAWSLLARLPGTGRPVRLVAGLSAAGRTLADEVLPGAVAAATDLQPQRLRPQPDHLDLTALAGAQAPLQSSDRAAAAVVRRVDALPSSGVPPLDRRADGARAALASAAARLHGLATVTRLLPGLLGADGPRRYLVAFQNNAEARGTGGLPGSFGVLAAQAGRVRLERVASDGDIRISHPVSADLGPGFADRYTALGSYSIVVNANLTADFPSAARLLQGFWQQTSGQRVDGVIALDPVAESYLLQGSGPLAVPGVPVTLDADSLVGYVESRIYADFPDVPRRKAALAAIAGAAFGQVLHGAPAATLLSGLQRAVTERRLLVWSDHPDVESTVLPTVAGGSVPETAGPYAQLVLNNAAGSKLDYYVSAHLTWAGERCAGERRRTEVTVDLRNDAPTSGLPPYVTIRADDEPDRPLGAERLLVSLYATSGAQLVSASLDGRDEEVTAEEERGHPVLTADVTVPPQSHRVLRLELDEPSAPGAPDVRLPQTVRASTSDIRLPACRR